ncbi:MAG: WGR domain-containing protein [Oscillatoria sp. PMC 1051.18]|nr:WGR domain-containing protein [Oscillatoria sp. PMC 1050.18]MEC5030387.1 WGR domain-containing protein [Oscillatoria sp. PMC 1051.18]
MNTAVAASVLETYTLIYVDVDENSNKVWKGSIYEDGSFVAEWGRVGSKLQQAKNSYPSVNLAQKRLEQMKQQKLKKGYTEAQILTPNPVNKVTLKPEELEKIAATQIDYGEDDKAKDLIRYLVKVNIHQILSQTNIHYDSDTGRFSTPLGLVTPEAIAKARDYLAQISVCYNPLSLRKLVSKYLRLIPQKVGKTLDDSIFRTQQELQHQNDILSALDAALMETKQQIFNCKISRVPGSTIAGKKTFRWIRSLYESTINLNHQAAGYKLRRAYEIDIPSMQQDFVVKSAQIGNVKLHWHGTKASNILSILKQGLIIPPANAIQCTGRMFGNGIYGSEQSTKALNYATNYWNQSGGNNQRVYMLLCEFALGKEYCPTNLNVSFPVSGYDST